MVMRSRKYGAKIDSGRLGGICAKVYSRRWYKIYIAKNRVIKAKNNILIYKIIDKIFFSVIKWQVLQNVEG